jgi:NAD(P)-dependent dehydrogenase (short-subunit alcohol dehydrogenase family)
VHLASERPVVLVVGGSSGIGLAVAQRLSGPGRPDTALALLARDRVALERAARSVTGDPLLLPADVTDADDLEAAVQAVLDTHGRLDAVVATAQVMAYGTVEQVPAEVFERVVETAVHGTANLARTVLPVFRGQGHGTLVVVNSLLGEIAVPSMSAYVAAKWGQLGLVRSLQLELRDEPELQVCLVSPGAVDTPIYAQAATYAGSAGSAPPPVVAPDRVARAVVRCLDRPRRHVEVGPVNALSVLGFRLAPAVYDRLAGPLVRSVVLRGPAAAESSGNVLRPRAEGERVRGGWTLAGRLRDARGRARWHYRRGTSVRSVGPPDTGTDETA